MRTTTIITTIALTLFAGLSAGPTLAESGNGSTVVTIDGPASDGPDERSASPVQKPVTIAGNPQQVVAATRAISRFRDAGLPLPPLDIAFHEHRSGCRGHQGVFRMVDGLGEIEICGTTRQLLLHELAHAWEAAHMSDQTRDAVMTYWNVDNWNDHDQSAGARGAEKVANAIAFALDNPPTDPNPTLRKSLCSYRLVTGHDLPSELAQGC